MSEEPQLTKMQLAQIQANAQAIAQVLMGIVPQAFTSQTMLERGKGEIDEWKMSKISSRALISLIYFRHRGEHDHVRFYEEFADHFLRGSHSIDGFGLKMLENIAIGLGGGGGGRRKLKQRPGWVGRHITQRDWKQKARDDSAQIIE